MFSHTVIIHLTNYEICMHSSVVKVINWYFSYSNSMTFSVIILTVRRRWKGNRFVSLCISNFSEKLEELVVQMSYLQT